MNYLLDTHALIWFVEGDVKLPQRIRALIAQSIAEDFTAVTHDRRFKAYPVKLAFF